MPENIILFDTEDGKIRLNVKLEADTVWLTQAQMVELFGRDQSVISRHVRNVFAEGELDEKSNMHFLHIANSDRPTTYYNLDVIISVGYRVKSQRGTKFRIWATQVLRQHLVQGYTMNQTRLAELQRTVQIISQTLDPLALNADEAKGVLEVIHSYSRAMEMLMRYDERSFDEQAGQQPETYALTEVEALEVIALLKEDLQRKGQASELFGRQREASLGGILQTLYQTFDGVELYPTVEEKAAHLLYFIIKNHPFADGNKRIGSLLFVWYLDLNRHLRRKAGEAKVNDNALTALALLVAGSDPVDKDLMIQLIINLIV